MSRLIARDPWLAGVLASFVVLAWASWGKLGDFIVDVGHEVEIPARLLSGELLYRDVEINYGPFAYYANALVLLVFGHHLEVFFAIGLVLAGAATLLVYLLARRLTDAPWAALCALCLQLYCVFSPRPFNYVFTYSYGSVYAIVLSLGAFVCLAHYYARGQNRWLVIAAVATGLACLSKQEYGVALAGCLIVGVNLAPGGDWRRRLAATGLLLGVSGALVAGVLTWFALQMSWQTLASFLLPTNNFGNLARSSLFQISPLKTIGIWWSSLQEFLIQLLIVGGALVAVAAARRSLAKRFAATWVLGVAEVLGAVALVAAALVARMLLTQTQAEEYFALHPLASLAWLLPAMLVWSLARGSRQSPLLWVLLVHAWLLNARWLFHIDFFELYSFSALILFFACLHWAAHATHLPIARYLLVCLLVTSGFRLYRFCQRHYPVHSPHGTIYVREAAKADALNRTIETVLTLKPASLLVLPEGALLNFLTNTHSPVAQLTFLPSVLPTSEQEQALLARLHRHPPDVVIELYRPFPEWGFDSYAEFNPLIRQWVLSEHRLLQTLPLEKGEVKIYLSAGAFTF